MGFHLNNVGIMKIRLVIHSTSFAVENDFVVDVPIAEELDTLAATEANFW